MNAEEIDTLNRLVVIFLEQAELRAKQQKALTLDFWRNNVDRMLEFNDKLVLADAGTVRREHMERIAHERYDMFDSHRRAAEQAQADAEDLRQIEQLEGSLKARGQNHE